MSIAELIGFDDVSITAVGSGAEALRALRTKTFDCVVLDLRLPDMSGFDLLTEIQKDPGLRDTADRRLHGPRAVRSRGDRAAPEGQEHRAQGRQVAGATAR